MPELLPETYYLPDKVSLSMQSATIYTDLRAAATTITRKTVCGWNNYATWPATILTNDFPNALILSSNRKGNCPVSCAMVIILITCVCMFERETESRTVRGMTASFLMRKNEKATFITCMCKKVRLSTSAFLVLLLQGKPVLTQQTLVDD